MLNLLGLRLHPAIGIVGGPVLVVIGLVLAVPVLCFVGAAMLLGTVWRSLAGHGDDADHHGPGR